MVEQIFRLLPLAPYFDIVLTAEDTPRHKPEPDPYLLGLDRLGVGPEATVVFEDSDVGASAAVAAGIPVIAYRHEFNKGHSFKNVAARIDSVYSRGGGSGAGVISHLYRRDRVVVVSREPLLS